MDPKLLELGKAVSIAMAEVEAAKIDLKKKKKALELAQAELNRYANVDDGSDDQ